MQRVMEIYFVENESINTSSASKAIVERFKHNPQEVGDALLHTGHFFILDESENFQQFLSDMGIQHQYNKDTLIIPLPKFTGDNEETFRLFQTYLGHIGHDFEIQENMQRHPNNLYFAIFDEVI